MGKSKNRVELPVGFFVETAPILREYAINHGLDPAVEFENFSDYHLAHGSKFVDWSAAFRTWCRNAVKFKAERDPRPIGFTAPKAQPQAVARAIQENAEIAKEVAGMTLAERRAASQKFSAIIASIKVK